MHIAIVGASGLVGGHLWTLLSGGDATVSKLSFRPDGDRFNENLMYREIDKLKPDILINCAAFLGLKPCKEKTELAYAVNANLPRLLAKIGTKIGAKVIQLSTDAVFPENVGGRCFYETDTPNPHTVYGKSKLAGELAVQNYENSYIMRLPRIIDPHKQMVANLIRSAKKGITVNVSLDAVSTPVTAFCASKVIIEKILDIASSKEANRILHITGDTLVSVSDLIFRILSPEFHRHVNPVNEAFFGEMVFDEHFLCGGLNSSFLAPVTLEKSIMNFNGQTNSK